MAGNRVDELEAKVRELEATVDGLTDEIIETKERLEALEGESPDAPDILEGRTTRSEAQQATTEQAATDAGSDAEPQAGDGEASADEVNTDEADGEDNADSESGDDIIVA